MLTRRRHQHRQGPQGGKTHSWSGSPCAWVEASQTLISLQVWNHFQSEWTVKTKPINSTQQKMLFCCNQEIPETIKKKIGMVDSWWFTWKFKILIQLNKNLQTEINTKWKKWQRVVIQGVLTIKDRIQQQKNRQTWISYLQMNDWWPGKEFQNVQLTRNLRGPFSPLKMKRPVLRAWSQSMGDKHGSHTSVFTRMHRTSKCSQQQKMNMHLWVVD